MQFYGISEAYGAEVNWQNGLRELPKDYYQPVNFDKSQLNRYQQKIAQYLEKEPAFERCQNFKDVLGFNAFLFLFLVEHAHQRRVVLGGDHSIALATVEASLASLKDGEKLNILWLDAHGDYNTPLTSPSGNIHGMPLYYLMNSSSYKKRINKVFLLGVSSLDSGEEKLIAEDERIVCLDYEQFNSADKALRLLEKHAGGNAFHVSFDIDLLPVEQAPGTGCQIESGVDWELLKKFFPRFFEKFKLLAMDIVEYNPDLDKEGKTKAIVLELLELLRSNYPMDSFFQEHGKMGPVEKKYLQMAEDYMI